MSAATTSAAVDRYGFTTLVRPALELERCAVGVGVGSVDAVVDAIDVGVGVAAAVVTAFDVDVVDALDSCDE